MSNLFDFGSWLSDKGAVDTPTPAFYVERPRPVFDPKARDSVQFRLKSQESGRSVLCRKNHGHVRKESGGEVYQRRVT